MAACNVLPVSARPDGFSWTGFVFIPRNGGIPGYALFYRELATDGYFAFDFRRYFPDAKETTVLSPRGKADFEGVETPELDFVWVRFEIR